MNKKSEKKLGLVIAGVMVVVVAILLWLVMKPTPAQKNAAADSQGKTSSSQVSKTAGSGLKTDADYLAAYMKANKDFVFTSWYTPDLKVAGATGFYKNSDALTKEASAPKSAAALSSFEKWINKYPKSKDSDSRAGKSMPVTRAYAKDGTKTDPLASLDKNDSGQARSLAVMYMPTPGLTTAQINALITKLRPYFANGKTMPLADLLKMVPVPPINAELSIHPLTEATTGDTEGVDGGQSWLIQWSKAGDVNSHYVSAYSLNGQVNAMTLQATSDAQKMVTLGSQKMVSFMSAGN